MSQVDADIIWKGMVQRTEGDGAVKAAEDMILRSPPRPPWHSDRGQLNGIEEDGRGTARILSHRDVARIMSQLRHWTRTWQPLFGSFSSIPVAVHDSQDEMITRFSQSTFSSYSGVLHLQRLPREKERSFNTMLLLCTTTGGEPFNCRYFLISLIPLCAGGATLVASRSPAPKSQPSTPDHQLCRRGPCSRGTCDCCEKSSLHLVTSGDPECYKQVYTEDDRVDGNASARHLLPVVSSDARLVHLAHTPQPPLQSEP